LASGYFPKEGLKKILPKRLSIPSDNVMEENYPTVKKVNGKHPFLLMFSNCHNVHDVATEHNLRKYLKINFFSRLFIRTRTAGSITARSTHCSTLSISWV
jgi:hypothetical protein